MYLQIESQRTSHRPAYSRLAEWWPAALIGLVALLSGLPDANAGTLPGALTSIPGRPEKVRARPRVEQLDLSASIPMRRLT